MAGRTGTPDLFTERGSFPGRLARPPSLFRAALARLALSLLCIYKCTTMMEGAIEFDGFEWDEGNWEKCQKHGVSLLEIEQALSVIRFVVDDPFPDEKRYRTVGRTAAGRYVFAAFMLRGSKLRPISARYMHEREVARYEKEMAGFEDR